MRLRGFGDIIGYQQSGIKNFRFADPIIHQDLFLLAEKYIRSMSINVNDGKYSFLLKLFDKAEIINQNIDLFILELPAETINLEACSNVTSK